MHHPDVIKHAQYYQTIYPDQVYISALVDVLQEFKLGFIRTSICLYLFGTPEEEEEPNMREEETVAGEPPGMSRGNSSAACVRWSVRPPSVLAAFCRAAAIALDSSLAMFLRTCLNRSAKEDVVWAGLLISVRVYIT
jgi:hypothetical protein